MGTCSGVYAEAQPHVGTVSTGRGQLVTALAKLGKQGRIPGLSPGPPPFPFTALGSVGKGLIRSKAHLPLDPPLCPTL